MNRDTPEPTASVYVQPAPHGIWSNNNNFGFELAFRAQRGNRERIVKLPEWGEPAVWTVSLGIDFSASAWPGALRGFDVTGEISYGVGGATEVIHVDWLDGTTFSVPMNAISVDAFWAFPETAGYSRPPEDVKLRVLLARGSRGGGIPPTKFAKLLNGEPYLTVDSNDIAEPVARIPKFGKKLFLAPLDRSDLAYLLGSNNFLRFLSAPDPSVSALSTGTFPIDSELLRTGVPVPAFSKYVTIENAGGGEGNAQVQLNFELQL